MNAVGLVDLEELILLCRDERSRSYIAEAINCYKACAFRASIVATWIAVCFDIIEKLKELSLTGDKAAEKVLSDIEEARSSGDLFKALRLERSLLNKAKDQFELISPIEHEDLERLQLDRNRCAHPSLISSEQPFMPSAELARLHIRSAVTHLLQHPPVQGKYALERLIGEVGSEYFPTSERKAVASLSSGPLKRPRETLVRSFSIWLLKQVLSPSSDFQATQRCYAALLATRSMHAAAVESLMADKLSPLFRALVDHDLHLGIRLILQLRDCWQYFAADVRHRVEAYVSALPANQLDDLGPLFSFEPLSSQAKGRLQRASRKELSDSLFFELHPIIADKFIDIYLNSKSFSEANDWATNISIYVRDFSELQQRRMLEGMSSNGEIYGSFEVATVISSLRQSKRIDENEIDKLLVELGFGKYVSQPDDVL